MAPSETSSRTASIRLLGVASIGDDSDFSLLFFFFSAPALVGKAPSLVGKVSSSKTPNSDVLAGLLHCSKAAVRQWVAKYSSGRQGKARRGGETTGFMLTASAESGTNGVGLEIAKNQLLILQKRREVNRQGSGTVRVILVCSRRIVPSTGEWQRVAGVASPGTGSSLGFLFSSLCSANVQLLPVSLVAITGNNLFKLHPAALAGKQSTRRTKLQLGRAGNSLAVVTSVKPQSLGEAATQILCNTVTQQQGAGGKGGDNEDGNTNGATSSEPWDIHDGEDKHFFNHRHGGNKF